MSWGLGRREKRKKDCPPVQFCAQSVQSGLLESRMAQGLGSEAQRRLFEQIRQAVPLVDAAIGKIIRLVGDFELECSNRQAQVWMKISFCCPSGEECWRLWERCAQRLLFSDKLGAEQIECGEAVWQKDWGGVVLPVKLCCKFLISGSTGEASQPMPEQVRVVRKGV